MKWMEIPLAREPFQAFLLPPNFRASHQSCRLSSAVELGACQKATQIRRLTEYHNLSIGNSNEDKRARAGCPGRSRAGFYSPLPRHRYGTVSEKITSRRISDFDPIFWFMKSDEKFYDSTTQRWMGFPAHPTHLESGATKEKKKTQGL